MHLWAAVGLQYVQDKWEITINQDIYINDVIKDFKTKSSEPVCAKILPILVNTKSPK